MKSDSQFHSTVHIPRALLAIASTIGQQSELVDAARQVAKRPDNVLGLLLRALTREEIAVMEDRGCRCDDWSLIHVAQDFDAFRVRRVNFKGACVLGRFSGEVELLPGFSQATGVYDCTLVNCQIGNDSLVENVRLAANLIIDREVLLFDIGSIACGGKTTFGCGRMLPIACETGGREVPLWAELTVPDAATIAQERGDLAGQAAIRAAAADYAKAVTSPVGWIRRKARVLHTERIRDAFIGAGAVIDHAHELDDVALLSSTEEPITVSNGAAVTGSVVQWGVSITGGGIVRRSALLEHSAVDAHATVEDSVIGPNTHIAKGEVTASLVGPFVGFHHQSLLIAAFWPEGKGNIAYGAMVGSNHTGRAPDQEIWPGEGTFFGLGCSIRLPTDFSEAPYSTISFGVATLPQKVRFPFSLIAVPIDPLSDESGVPRAYNEIVPAWTLRENAYGLVRNELKYGKRDRAKRHVIDYKVLRPQLMRLVRDARDRLRAVTVVKPAYLESDISGLGRNFLRDSVRLEAIATYEQTLVRYALRILLNEAESGLTIPGSAEIGHELADELVPGLTRDQRLLRLVEIERDNARLVERSKAKDDERGEYIIPGYAQAHTPAAMDPVVKSAWARVERTVERVRALGIAVSGFAASGEKTNRS
jgi:hypothetical protein